MTSKERLREYRGLELEIKAKIEQRARLRYLLTQAGDDANVRSRYAETDVHVKRQIEELFKKQAEIRRAIDNVEDCTLRKLLEYRYINGWSLKKISGKMYISYDWLRHLHGAALLRVHFRETESGEE